MTWRTIAVLLFLVVMFGAVSNNWAMILQPTFVGMLLFLAALAVVFYSLRFFNRDKGDK